MTNSRIVEQLKTENGVANQINIDWMRKLGYSADSIAINMGISKRQLEAIEREPVAVLAEPKHGVCRCGGALV